MKNAIISILAVILGLLIIAFPVLGVVTASAIIGLSILLLGVYLMIAGISELDYSPTRSILNITIGVIMLILSIGIIFNPSLFAFLAAITLYLAGIFLMVAGLVTLIGNRENKYGFWMGIVGIALGILYIILGTYIRDPLILGSLIGIWLMIAGVLRLADR
ncbi:acid-resistance membrane protein [Methanobrevibacter cuticularis]|uniref:Acid-resistance membrane protein n=1 Tax=Methanobrevibacter cuticularis TaxID=47311 RepID=A0A166EQI5_9EURY|nr:DUF308 domain-containing protein [Methanobrevibacter cuticularis]KZX16901.1 acid-resistance membrane protein [Methanobrevibacter cuticularis]